MYGLIPSPEVVVLTLNYNSAYSLKSIVYESIESALSITYQNLDVAVVDNCSTDRSFEAMEAKFGKDITALKLNRNYGYAGGNEFGFQSYVSRKSLPKYVIFMNNDYVIKNEDFVRGLVSFLKSRDDVLLAGGYNLQEDGLHIADARFFIDSLTNLIPRYFGLKKSDCPKAVSYVTYVLGA
ncbi:MAG: glycosyltransferase [Nitrososphaeria archaeon]